MINDTDRMLELYGQRKAGIEHEFKWLGGWIKKDNGRHFDVDTEYRAIEEFDIRKHEWGDKTTQCHQITSTAIYLMVSNGYSSHSTYLTEADSIAIAKHFNPIGKEGKQ